MLNDQMSKKGSASDLKRLQKFRATKGPVRIFAERVSAKGSRRKPSGTARPTAFEGESIIIPAEAMCTLVRAVELISEGKAVEVVEVSPSEELTTQEAADILNVSRPYLVKLLNEAKIPYRKVGNRRRVRRSDLLDYKRKDDAFREGVLRELAAEAQELGLGY